MLTLNEISLSQKAEIDRFLKKENSRSADYNFGNIYMWDKRFMQSVAVCGDRLITLLHRKNEKFFAFPVGSGDIRPAFALMHEYCEAEGIPFRISGICDEHLALMNDALPDRFIIEEDRDFSDYIYDIEKLAAFPGKHLHAKRNFCNRFEAEHDWRFEPLTRSKMPECKALLDKWTQQSAERLSRDYVYEQDAILRGFEHYDELGLEGGILYAEDGPVGFSIGEVISSDTFCIHFEKALADVDGAYPMVCREMAKQALRLHGDLRYVNREDDMGNPALRKSKLSYKPEFILKKYTASLK